jgi:uncharacterized protein (DUF1778 family)
LYAVVTHMPSPPSTSVLSVRVNPGERAILEAAAEQSHTSLGDFIRRKALESAEIDRLSQAIVTIPAKDWEAFESWIRRGPRTILALRELGRRKPTWED